MLTNKTVFLLPLFLLNLVLAGPVFALVVNGSDTHVSVNNGAFFDGTSAAGQSLYSQEILTTGNETKYGDVAFSDIPFFDFSSTLYFKLSYDQQETGPAPNSVSIDDILIYVNGTTGTLIWDYDQATYGSIILNGNGADQSDSPLGNGSDLDLFVPVALFYGLGLTGDDILTLCTTQSMSDNGPDEWVTLTEGTFFDPEDPIDPEDPPPTIPEPSTFLLLGGGLAGLAFVARRRKKE